jgi:hypothetical protein
VASQKTLDEGTVVSRQVIDEVDDSFAGVRGFRANLRGGPTPEFCAFPEWLTALRKVVEDLPPEVKTYLHNARPDTRNFVLRELTELSEKIDWLRSEFHDADRKAP